MVNIMTSEILCSFPFFRIVTFFTDQKSRNLWKSSKDLEISDQLKAQTESVLLTTSIYVQHCIGSC